MTPRTLPLLLAFGFLACLYHCTPDDALAQSSKLTAGDWQLVKRRPARSSIGKIEPVILRFETDGSLVVFEGCSEFSGSFGNQFKQRGQREVGRLSITDLSHTIPCEENAVLGNLLAGQYGYRVRRGVLRLRQLGRSRTRNRRRAIRLKLRPVAPPQCGNNECEYGEADFVDPGGCGPDAPPECLGPPARLYPGRCPADCSADPVTVCGDGLCEGYESPNGCDPPVEIPDLCAKHIFCPEDCAGETSCGDGVCEIPEIESCEADCKKDPPTECGNGICDEGEDPIVCDPKALSALPCIKDILCPEDCEEQGPICGNKICEPGEADSFDGGGCGPGAPPECLGPPAVFKPGSCPEDCPTEKEPPRCGDGRCEGGESPFGCDPPAELPNLCAGHIYCPEDCSADGGEPIP